VENWSTINYKEHLASTIVGVIHQTQSGSHGDRKIAVFDEILMK
jgi:hypothetical protein